MNETGDEQGTDELKTYRTKEFGLLTLQNTSEDNMVEVLTDENGTVLIYYNGSLRAIVREDFWRQAECSIDVANDYLQLKTADYGFLNIPLKTNIMLVEDEFDDEIIIG